MVLNGKLLSAIWGYYPRRKYNIMSPLHYAVNANVINGSVTFNNSKVGIVTFDIPFTKIPIIQITLNGDTSSTVPYKAGVSTTGLTIRFQNAYTGTVDWIGLQRQ